MPYSQSLLQLYQMHQSNIHQDIYHGDFGQIFIASQETNGNMESLIHFRGRQITNISGGFKKIFVMEDTRGNQAIISTLHSPQYDDFDLTFSQQGMSSLGIQEIISSFDDKGRVKKIECGKHHTIFLTEQGKIYSYGKGEYGTLGHGGVVIQNLPRIIKKLQNRIIYQIACGEFHSLALSKYGDVYSWGRGFQGQLGLATEVTSSPQLISAFSKTKSNGKKLQKNQIKSIACGAYHSLAINVNGQLYSWGESRYGQTGLGRTIKVSFPTQVTFKCQDVQVHSVFDMQIKNTPSPSPIKQVAAGFGHTLAITQNGNLWSWGINVKGQLGVGDIADGKQGKWIKGIYFPQLVTQDCNKVELPKIVNISCGYSTSFAIDQHGFAWGWGGGYIGLKDIFAARAPTKLMPSESHRFKYVYANQNSVTFFSPMRLISIKPILGPSLGDTQITVLGTGFVDTGQQMIKFSIQEKEWEVKANYDVDSESFYCRSPRFDQNWQSSWPKVCYISLTLSTSYIKLQTPFLVYPSSLQMTSISPTSSSINSSLQLSLYMDIHKDIQKYLSHLTVGFRPTGTQNWVCVYGSYSEGIIKCQIPKVNSTNGVEYKVDVSLNGQQFTNMPSTFTFYNLQNLELSPKQGLIEGGNTIIIKGEGLMDTIHKKLKFIMKGQIQGERLVDMNWNREQRWYESVVPPADWLVQGDVGEGEIEKIKGSVVFLELTLNSIEWMSVGEYKYVVPQPPKEQQVQDQKKKKGGKEKKGGKK